MVYLLVRFSPLLEFSESIRSLILIIGATGGLFLGLIAIVNNDIKRVVAYSTLSQLGYMMSAVGASAYALAMFHLMTHAFFKALLFLAAGAVIASTHHEQDMRKYGGLFKDMPIIASTFLIGSLSLMAVPLFSGFYSKDTVIMATATSEIWGAGYAHICLMLGVMVTSIYSVRAFYMTFLGEKRYTGKVEKVDSSITVPLVLLSIPSAIIGLIMAPILGQGNWFGDAIFYTHLAKERMVDINHMLEDPIHMAIHSLSSLPFWLMLVSSLATYFVYRRGAERGIACSINFFRNILIEKFYFDWVVERVLVPSIRAVSSFFSQVTDGKIIDYTLVMGSARVVQVTAKTIKSHVSGYLYHYALLMLGGIGIMCYLVVMV